MTDTFALTNDPPKPPRGDFPGRDKQQQKVLFTGLDLPPNTRELFDTSYTPNERSDDGQADA
jgi:hypothetical protein